MQQVTRKIIGVAVLSVAAAVATTGVASADTSAGPGLGAGSAAQAKVNEQLRDIAKKYPQSVQNKKGPLGLPVSSSLTNGLAL
ncbi:MAG TPA: hypothetical protein VNS49_02625 [Streptomyces sp.]|nr:hypothetical protein [Streptomyces sp.]